MAHRTANRPRSVRRSPVRDILSFHNRSDMISLAGGLPAYESLPVADMARAAQRVLALHGPRALQYGTTEGYAPLRAWIANRLCRQGLPTRENQILITGGSQQAMDLVGRFLLHPGDIVLTTEPIYNGAIQCFELQNAKVQPIPTDSSGPIPDRLRSLLHPNRPCFRAGFTSLSRPTLGSEKRPALLYLLPTLGNPSGSIISEQRRSELAKIIDESAVSFLEEDPYGELFEGVRLPFIQSMTRTPGFLLGSFSKIVAPSLRIGWIRADEDRIQQLVPFKQTMDLHTNLLSQMILHQFLSDVDLDAHIASIKSLYAERRNAMLQEIRNQNIELTSLEAPQGGMFLWLKFPEGLNTDELARLALEEGVAFVPGSAFFAESQKGQRFARLNFTAADCDQIRTGIARLKVALDRLSVDSSRG